MQHKTRVFALREMIRLVASGGAALPEFQRDFVWDPNQVIELLDSVANGWPIGSLLILEGPQPFGIKSLEGGPSVERDSVRYYLLDGQQRVTSLYHALTDTGEYIYYLDFKDSAPVGEDAPPFRWVARTRGIPVARQRTSLTVAEMADEDYFDTFVNSLAYGEAPRARAFHKARMGYIAGGEYAIPATLMLRDIELEALTRIFETLNRTGVRLDAFDLMVAVLYPDGFHLRNEWEQARADHSLFHSMNAGGLELLKLIALWRREEDRRNPSIRPSRRVLGVRQRDVLRTPPAYVRNQWQTAVVAYDAALRFLHDEGGIRGGDGVPSDAMILTLSYLLNAAYPADLVRRWYWGSIADQRYLQGANTQILADVDAIDSEFVSKESVLSQLADSLKDPIRRNRILRLGVRGLLIRNGALDLVTGSPIEGAAADVAISDLMEGKVATGPDRPATEILVLSRESLDELKRQARVRPLADLVSPVALRSQAAPSLESRQDSDWRSSRSATFVSWMESLL